MPPSRVWDPVKRCCHLLMRGGTKQQPYDMPENDAGSGDGQHQCHSGLPNTTGNLYRRYHVFSDECDDRSKHGIYDSSLETPRPPVPTPSTLAKSTLTTNKTAAPLVPIISHPPCRTRRPSPSAPKPTPTCRSSPPVVDRRVRAKAYKARDCQASADARGLQGVAICRRLSLGATSGSNGRSSRSRASRPDQHVASGQDHGIHVRTKTASQQIAEQPHRRPRFGIVSRTVGCPAERAVRSRPRKEPEGDERLRRFPRRSA